MAESADTYFRGSCITPTHTLRVTERCATADLGADSGAPFEELIRHDIVKSFVSRRRDRTDDTREVTPLTSGHTVFRLSYGHDHRGATWFDEDERIVWLLAYGRHRSGKPDDAFQIFKELDAAGNLFPTPNDYKRAFDDHDLWLAQRVVADAQELLSAARADQGVEQRGMLGGDAALGVLVEVVETLEETFVAFPAAALFTIGLDVLLAAFFPTSTLADWDLRDALPTRPAADGEVVYVILRAS